MTYVYNFNKAFWEKIPGGAEIPKLDSHAAFLVDDVMYIYGGFKDKEAAYDGNIYALDLNTRKWSVFYKYQPKDPEPRGNVGLVVKGDEVWVFGGTNGTKTLNDLWKFNMKTKKWTEVKAENPP